MRIAGSHIIAARRTATPPVTLVKMLLPLWLHSMTAAFVIGLRTSLAADVFPLGTTHLYRLHSTTLLDELQQQHLDKGGGAGGGGTVGFRLTSDVRVTSLWAADALEAKLLRVHATGWRLHVRAAGDAFSAQPSRLDALAAAPFYVRWRAGRVDKVLLPAADAADVDVRALKRGIASMLQFQLSAQETHEVDVSGHCHASYAVAGPAHSIITKEKHCDAPQRAGGILAAAVASRRRAIYTLAPEKSDFTKISAIEVEEEHVLALPSYNAVGARAALQQVLTLQTLSDSETPTIDAETMEAAEQHLLQKEDLTIQTLDTIDHHPVESRVSFGEQVKASRATLQDNKMVPEAKTAVKLLNAARYASKDDILRVLKDAKYMKIRSELLDILGSAQTTASHAAVTKIYHMDDAAQRDLNERYLWALSFSANPNPEIMEDLLRKFKNTQNIPEKVRDTLISTLASMARNLRATANFDQKIYNDIQSIIVNYMDASSAAGERATYLRALINLQSPSTLPLLLDIVSGSKKERYTPKEVALAWRAILLIVQRDAHANHAEEMVQTIRKQAVRTFLQLRAREDSTSRAVAFDTLLALTAGSSAIVDEMVDVIVNYLRAGDADAEINQYVLQRLRMLSEGTSNRRLARALDRRLRENSSSLMNYNVFAPKGLSVAMATDFYTQGGFNQTDDQEDDTAVPDMLRGGLSSVQEIQKGFVKRGVVSVTMARGSDDMELFGLGIFTSGLGNFMGGSEEGDSEGDAMAGMELSVLGTHLRPFVFFTGQGELMGHVWSGTGSERTTAFQALMILHDHEQRLHLGNGLTLNADVKSAASMDLSGQITISLWYRNADAKVEKSAGIFSLGALSTDASFVSSRIEFSTSLEPRLTLAANVDFASNDVSLCMRLSQPPLEYAHNVYKIERVDGSKHRLRRRVRRRHPVPGKTYALNQKNADMCNAIFSS